MELTCVTYLVWGKNTLIFRELDRKVKKTASIRDAD